METQLKLTPKGEHKTSASGWTWPSAITDMNRICPGCWPTWLHASTETPAFQCSAQLSHRLSHGRSLDGKRWRNGLENGVSMHSRIFGAIKKTLQLSCLGDLLSLAKSQQRSLLQGPLDLPKHQLPPSSHPMTGCFVSESSTNMTGHSSVRILSHPGVALVPHVCHMAHNQQ